jgi:hypothetical protein
MGSAIGETDLSEAIVFNHHSLPFDTISLARENVPVFLRVSLKASRIGYSVILVDESVDGKWFRLQLADAYYFQDWQRQEQENSQSRDSIRAFLSLATRQSLFLAEDYQREVELFDVHLPGNRMSLSALRSAAWHDAPIISFLTRDPWKSSPVSAIVDELSPDDGNIRSSKIEIDNLCEARVVEGLESRLRADRLGALHSGRQILDEKESRYPLLIFCGKSIEQLSSWSHSSTVLDQIKDSLSALNEFSRRWRSGEVLQYTHEKIIALGSQHKVSGESPSVTKNPFLRKFREFWLPSGTKEYFENHVKLAKGFRLHFFPDARDRTLYIGYIGPHLPLE